MFIARVRWCIVSMAAAAIALMALVITRVKRLIAGVCPIVRSLVGWAERSDAQLHLESQALVIHPSVGHRFAQPNLRGLTK